MLVFILICIGIAIAVYYLQGTPKSSPDIANSIRSAIATGSDVVIQYEKEDGTTTSRTVTPREMRKLSILELQDLVGDDVKIRKEGRLCMFGYCHLRRADRVFAVDRIKEFRRVST